MRNPTILYNQTQAIANQETESKPAGEPDPKRRRLRKSANRYVKLNLNRETLTIQRT